MLPRPSSYAPLGSQRLRWWLVVGLAAFLLASLASWIAAAPPAGGQHAAAAGQSAASRSGSAPASPPARALDVNGDSVPDLVLPALAVTLTTRPASIRRLRTAGAAIPFGHQVAPLPQPPRIAG